ncbi:MAG: right-handed parallel beta-helix repeat-containing protein [Planctomycetota bacterium]|jgi:hypothetical protein
MRVCVALPAACFWLACSCALGADVFVSPDGNDAGPGTRARPLQTFAAAQRAVRKLKTLESGPINVFFLTGRYYLPETVVFTGQDSGAEKAPICYASAPGEQVTLSGGTRLDLKWKPYRGGILTAEVPAGEVFNQLFVDGRRQPMARYPNFDPSAQYWGGFSADCASPERVARWPDPAGGFLHAMHRSLWGDFHYLMTGKDADGNLQHVGGWQNNRKMGMHREYRFVENVFEELDAPGEWYHDGKTRTLYYCPPEGASMERAVVEAVRLRNLIEFRGSEPSPVRFIILRGMTLTHAARTFMENKEPLVRSDWTTYRGGAIFFNGAEDCAVRDCVVDQVGGNAVFVNRYNRRVEITGCRISGAGASAVSFVGDPGALRSPLFEYHETQTLDEMDKTPGPKTNDYPAGCLVENNLIYRNGRFEKQTAGVNIAMAGEITVRHNSIYDCPRAGINVCDGAFGGHLIELNDVFDTVKETGDHGSFNSWGRDRFWHKDRGVTVEWLKDHTDMPRWDARKTTVLRNNRWRCDHGWDVDLDDGSSNYEIYNNLCLAGGIKLREGYSRKVYNNVLVGYTFCPHVWYPGCESTFTRNIVWEDGYRPARMQDMEGQADYNLVHSPGERPRPAEGLRQFSGGDRHSIVADAAFVDPLSGDYRVKEGSPALGLGFENFPMDRFGVQKPELKALARTPPLPGTIEAAALQSGGWGRRYASAATASWLGATLKNIDDEGEMSAVGLASRDGVLVVEVAEGSAAAKLGFQPGDVILRIDDGAAKSLQEFAQRYKQLGRGQTADVTVWRNQAERTLRIEKP